MACPKCKSPVKTTPINENLSITECTSPPCAWWRYNDKRRMPRHTKPLKGQPELF
jgi:hypothetical protein